MTFLWRLRTKNWKVLDTSSFSRDYVKYHDFTFFTCTPQRDVDDVILKYMN